MQHTLLDECGEKPGREGEAGWLGAFGQRAPLQGDFATLVSPYADGKTSARKGLTKQEAEYGSIGELPPGQLGNASGGDGR